MSVNKNVRVSAPPTAAPAAGDAPEPGPACSATGLTVPHQPGPQPSPGPAGVTGSGLLAAVAGAGCSVLSAGDITVQTSARRHARAPHGFSHLLRTLSSPAR
jgi:hypothetical protein